MSSRYPFRRWYVSAGARAYLPEALKSFLGELPDVLSPDADEDLVVCTASEVLQEDWNLPDWIGSETKYLVVLDIPEPAILRLPTVLRLHKPDQRLHVTRDGGAVGRLVIAFSRDVAWEAIVDAYLLEDRLVVVLGDLRMPEFPRVRIPGLQNESDEVLSDFAIDSSGSFLFWESLDVHLGPSQLMQAVDPMHLADVEIERYERSKVSAALQLIRETNDLRQADIVGLSERQVRRLENEESRFTTEAAEKYAATLGWSMDQFLGQLGAHVSDLKDERWKQGGGNSGDGPTSTPDNASVLR